ncbi:hypothetical protein M378DRAFT_858790 [Amanita muscaria Koide BX008]|uniref:Mug135-like C-terminal domain-containing protein n=1 Tax=Amanita muscaria (strain Koide BX008) TaxID=946122 RepID=A0A0C2SEB7_AMAMK|nr:hypothetical protein M378DRAFT_858790 [Amanita muscaria Koide BX008]
MKRDMQTMKDDNTVIKRDIRTLKDDNTVIKRDIRTLKDDNTIIKRDIQTLKDDNTVIKQDIQTLKDDSTVIKQDIRNIKEDIQTLKNDNADIKQDVGEFKINLAMTRRLAAISHNARVGSTSEGYEIVFFPNSEDPNSEPHNLPPLTSMQAILDLGDAALDAYMRNYYPNNRGAIRDRNKRLNMVASAIGVGKLPSHV